jgi:uncharacterized protein YdaU (DUF1376 family)
MLPYYPFFWGDYSNKTFDLTTYQHGVYFLLLRRIYSKGEPIPHEQRYSIAKALLEQERSDVDFVLAEYFIKKGDAWTNNRAMAIIRETNAKHEKRVKAGEKGGKKAKSTAKQSSSNAQAMLKQPELEPEPYIHTIINNSVCESVREAEPENAAKPTPTLSACADKKNILKTGGEKEGKSDGNAGNKRSHSGKGSSLPADWRPSEKCLESASGIGVTPQQLKLSEHRFRDHFLNRKGKGETSNDWDDTFLAWCAGDAQKRAAATERTGPDSAAGRGAPANKKRDYFDTILAGSAEVAQRQRARKRQEQLDRGLLGTSDFPKLEYDFPRRQDGLEEGDSEAFG